MDKFHKVLSAHWEDASHASIRSPVRVSASDTSSSASTPHHQSAAAASPRGRLLYASPPRGNGAGRPAARKLPFDSGVTSAYVNGGAVVDELFSDIGASASGEARGPAHSRHAMRTSVDDNLESMGALKRALLEATSEVEKLRERARRWEFERTRLADAADELQSTVDKRTSAMKDFAAQCEGLKGRCTTLEASLRREKARVGDVVRRAGLRDLAAYAGVEDDLTVLDLALQNSMDASGVFESTIEELTRKNRDHADAERRLQREVDAARAAADVSRREAEAAARELEAGRRSFDAEISRLRDTLDKSERSRSDERSRWQSERTRMSADLEAARAEALTVQRVAEAERVRADGVKQQLDDVSKKLAEVSLPRTVAVDVGTETHVPAGLDQAAVDAVLEECNFRVERAQEEVAEARAAAERERAVYERALASVVAAAEGRARRDAEAAKDAEFAAAERFRERGVPSPRGVHSPRGAHSGTPNGSPLRVGGGGGGVAHASPTLEALLGRDSGGSAGRVALEARVEELKSVVDALSRERDGMHVTVNDLEEQLRELQVTNAKKVTDNNRLKAQVREAEQAAARGVEHVRSLSAELERARSIAADANAECVRLRAETAAAHVTARAQVTPTSPSPPDAASSAAIALDLEAARESLAAETARRNRADALAQRVQRELDAESAERARLAAEVASLAARHDDVSEKLADAQLRLNAALADLDRAVSSGASADQTAAEQLEAVHARVEEASREHAMEQESLLRRIRDLESELAIAGDAARDEWRALHAQLSAAGGRIALLEAEAETGRLAQEERDALLVRLEDAVRAASVASAQMNLLRVELDETACKLTDVDGVLSATRAEAEGLAARLRASEASESALTLRLEEANARAAASHSAWQDTLERLNVVKTQCADALARMAGAERERDAVRADLEEARLHTEAEADRMAAHMRELEADCRTMVAAAYERERDGVAQVTSSYESALIQLRSESDAEIDRLAVQLAACDERCGHVTSSLADRTRELSDALRSLRDAEARNRQISEEHTRIVDAVAELEEAQRTIDSLQRAVDAAPDAVAVEGEVRAARESAVAAVRVEMDDLRGEVDELRASLRASEEACTLYKMDAEHKGIDCEEKAAQLAELDDEVERLSRELGDATSTIRDLQSAADESRARATEASSRLAEVEDLCHRRGRKIKDLKARVSALEETGGDAQRELMHARTQCDISRLRSDEWEFKCRSAIALAAERNEMLDAVSAELHDAREREEDLSQRAALALRLEDEVVGLRARIASDAATVAALKRDLASVALELSAAQSASAECDVLRSRAETLETENAELIARLTFAMRRLGEPLPFAAAVGSGGARGVASGARDGSREDGTGTPEEEIPEEIDGPSTPGTAPRMTRGPARRRGSELFPFPSSPFALQTIPRRLTDSDASPEVCDPAADGVEMDPAGVAAGVGVGVGVGMDAVSAVSSASASAFAVGDGDGDGENALTAQNEQNGRALIALRAEMEALEQRLATTAQLLAHEQALRHSLEVQSEEASAKMALLSKALTDADTERKRDAGSREFDIQMLQAQLTHVMEAAAAKEADNRVELDYLVEASRVCKEELEREVTALQYERDCVTESAAVVRTELEGLRAREAALAADYEAIVGVHNRLVAEHEAIAAKYAALLEERDVVVADRDALVAAAESQRARTVAAEKDWNAEREAMNRRVDDLADELKKCNADALSLTASKDVALAQLHDEIARLKRDLESLAAVSTVVTSTETSLPSAGVSADVSADGTIQPTGASVSLASVEETAAVPVSLIPVSKAARKKKKKKASKATAGDAVSADLPTAPPPHAEDGAADGDILDSPADSQDGIGNALRSALRDALVRESRVRRILMWLRTHTALAVDADLDVALVNTSDTRVTAGEEEGEEEGVGEEDALSVEAAVARARVELASLESAVDSGDMAVAFAVQWSAARAVCALLGDAERARCETEAEAALAFEALCMAEIDSSNTAPVDLEHADAAVDGVVRGADSPPPCRSVWNDAREAIESLSRGGAPDAAACASEWSLRRTDAQQLYNGRAVSHRALQASPSISTPVDLALVARVRRVLTTASEHLATLQLINETLSLRLVESPERPQRHVTGRTAPSDANASVAAGGDAHVIVAAQTSHVDPRAIEKLLREVASSPDLSIEATQVTTHVTAPAVTSDVDAPATNDRPSVNIGSADVGAPAVTLIVTDEDGTLVASRTDADAALAELEQARAQVHAAEKEIDRLRGAVGGLEDVVAALRAEESHRSAHLALTDDLLRDIDALGERLTENELLRKELESTLSETRGRLTESELLRTELESTLSETRGQLTESELLRTELESTLSETRGGLTESEQLRTALESTLSETRGRLTESELLRTELESTLSETRGRLESERRQWWAERAEVEEENAAVRAENAQLRVDLGEVIETNDVLGARVDEYKLQLSALVKELNALQSQSPSTAAPNATPVRRSPTGGDRVRRKRRSSIEMTIAVTDEDGRRLSAEHVEVPVVTAESDSKLRRRRDSVTLVVTDVDGSQVFREEALVQPGALDDSDDSSEHDAADTAQSEYASGVPGRDEDSAVSDGEWELSAKLRTATATIERLEHRQSEMSEELKDLRTVRSVLEDALLSTKDRAAAAEEELEPLRTRITDLDCMRRTMTESLEADLRGAQATATSLEEALVDARTRAAAAEKDTAELRLRVAELDEVIEGLQEEVADGASKQAMLLVELDRVRGLEADARRRLEELHDGGKRVAQGALAPTGGDDADNDSASASASASDADAAMRRLTREVTDLREQLTVSRTIAHEREQVCNSLATELDERALMLRELEKQLAYADSKLQENGELRLRVAHADDATRAALTECEALRTAVVELNLAVESANSSRDALQSTIGARDLESASLASELRRVEGELAEMRRLLEDAEQREADLRVRVSVFEKELHQRDFALGELERRNSVLDDQIADARADVDSASDEVEQVHDQLQGMWSVREGQLQADIRRLRGSYDALEAECAQLRADVMLAENARVHADSERRRLEDERNSVTLRLSDAEDKLDDRRADIATRDVFIEELKTAGDELRHKLSLLESDCGAARNALADALAAVGGGDVHDELHAELLDVALAVAARLTECWRAQSAATDGEAVLLRASRAEVDRLTAEVERLVDGESSLMDAVRARSSELASMEQSNANLTAALVDARASAQRSAETASAYAEELETLRRAMHEAEARRASMEDSLEALRVSAEAMRAALEEERGRAEDQSQLSRNIRAEFDAHVTSAEVTASQLASAREALSARDLALATAREELAEVAALLSAEKVRSSELEEALGVANDELSSCIEKLESLANSHAQLRRMTEELEALRNENHAVRLELDRAVIDRANSEAEHQSLVQTHQTLVQAHTALELRLRELSATATAKSGSALSDERAALLASELSTAKEERAEAEMRMQEFVAAGEAFGAQLESLREALDAERARSTELEDISDTLRSELDGATTRSLTLQAQLVLVASELEQLHADEKQAAKRRAKLKSRIAEKAGSLEQLSLGRRAASMQSLASGVGEPPHVAAERSGSTTPPSQSPSQSQSQSQPQSQKGGKDEGGASDTDEGGDLSERGAPSSRDEAGRAVRTTPGQTSAKDTELIDRQKADLYLRLGHTVRERHMLESTVGTLHRRIDHIQHDQNAMQESIVGVLESVEQMDGIYRARVAQSKAAGAGLDGSDTHAEAPSADDAAPSMDAALPDAFVSAPTGLLSRPVDDSPSVDTATAAVTGDVGGDVGDDVGGDDVAAAAVGTAASEQKKVSGAKKKALKAKAAAVLKAKQQGHAS